MSNLVDHARRELKIINEEESFTEPILKMVEIFAAMGHSGGSAAVAISMLTQLLEFHNLSPLTDDPDEWYFHGQDLWGDEGGIWQNKRNSEAFSADGGKTYYLLSEGANMAVYNAGNAIMHTSRPHTAAAHVQGELALQKDEADG